MWYWVDTDRFGSLRLLASTEENSTTNRHFALLGALIAITIGTFVLTRSLAAHVRDLRQDDGRAWYARAQAALAEGRVADAASAFRRAAATDPQDRRYQLALGGALAAGGRRGEARAVLLALGTGHPDDPEVSLHLARLEAAEGHSDEAFRHYRNTLTALWSADQTEARRHVRVEFIELLLQRGLTARALSELLVLSPGVPDDPAARIEVGSMFLRAGDAQRARELFVSVLERDAGNVAALAGAGKAAFALGDYAAARRWLATVPDEGDAAELRAVSNLVLTADPLAPRLSFEDRRRRADMTLAHARSVLDACGVRAADAGLPAGDLAALSGEQAALAALLSGSGALPSRETIDRAFDFAYRPVPIYDALLRQDHVHLPDPAAHAARGGHVARDVMSTHAVMVAGEAAVGQARQETDGRAAPACLVGTRDAFLGTVSATRLDEAVAEGRGSDPVSSLVDGPLLHAHADHPLTVVIERLAQSDGILPIVGRRNVRELEGTVTLDDVTRFLRRRPQR